MADWRVDRALEILAPEPSQRSQREHDIAQALEAIANAATVNKSLPSPREQKKLLARQERLLVELITITKREWPENPHLEAFWAALQTCRGRYPPKYAHKYSHEKMYAVLIAKNLLEHCGKRPTFDREGDWLQLSQILLSDCPVEPDGYKYKYSDLFEYIEELVMPLEEFLRKKEPRRRSKLNKHVGRLPSSSTAIRARPRGWKK